MLCTDGLVRQLIKAGQVRKRGKRYKNLKEEQLAKKEDKGGRRKRVSVCDKKGHEVVAQRLNPNTDLKILCKPPKTVTQPTSLCS